MGNKILFTLIATVVVLGIGGYLIIKQETSIPGDLANKVLQPTSTSGKTLPAVSTSTLKTSIPTITLDATQCTDYTVVKLSLPGYNDGDLEYLPENKFEGILQKYNKVPAASTVMRDLTYNLDGKAIYTRDDLSKYIGKRVILTGKNYKFELEGVQMDEIWPISIVCSPAPAWPY